MDSDRSPTTALIWLVLFLLWSFICFFYIRSCWLSWILFRFAVSLDPQSACWIDVCQLTPKLDAIKQTNKQTGLAFFRIIFMFLIKIRLKIKQLNKYSYCTAVKVAVYRWRRMYYKNFFLYQGLMYIWRVNYFCLVLFIFYGFFADNLCVWCYWFFQTSMCFCRSSSVATSWLNQTGHYEF